MNKVHKVATMKHCKKSMNWEKIQKDIEDLKLKKKKIRQSFMFDEKLYKDFEKAVGKDNITKALSLLMKAYLENAN
jgi:hypothetical protein